MIAENLAPYPVIDSHCHIYPAAIAPRAVKAVDGFYDGLPAIGYDGTVQSLLASGPEAGISHFIVHSVATSPAQVPSINRFIAESMKNSQGRFTGLGAMHPDSGDLKEDIRQLKSLGLHGVKVHPDIQKFAIDSREAFALYDLCLENDLPILVHTGDFRYDYSNPERTVKVLSAFPSLKIVGAHLGGWSVWERALLQLPDYENIRVDTSSSFYWQKPEKALEIIRAFGSERVLFGTDYPMWKQAPELDYLSKLPLTGAEFENILWRSCVKTYGVPVSALTPSGQLLTDRKEEKHLS